MGSFCRGGVRAQRPDAAHAGLGAFQRALRKLLGHGVTLHFDVDAGRDLEGDELLAHLDDLAQDAAVGDHLGADQGKDE